MWRIQHLLFGSHFVVIRYGYCDFIKRVQFTAEPRWRPYAQVNSQCLWLDDRSERWEALTFDKAAFVKEFCEPKPVMRVV